ncbi:putative cysteine-rich transmembrane CYSTM domain-containing protein [Rosa chinensis]|uniref:Putative cysteine-rich transmembrane CYSTM domain-containing protein n=1 Tax=Rosa chinensis TaxID=74649 RepID=A0A2P6RQR2_ROSCH|nr:putative cysteine-rich transmembrane CYSTM domain-containing protein [Rosa chinensis]
MSSSTTSSAAAYPKPPYSAPPPAGYPTRSDAGGQNGAPVPVETKSKGDGFWKGCCAALCCCCMLDACF